MVAVQSGAQKRVAREHWRRMSAVPLLVFVMLLYVAFAAVGADFALTRFTINMPSGGQWQVSLGDALLTLALFMLFFEILKSTRTGGKSVVDHALSTIVLVVCLALFLIWPPAATSLFFLITLTAFLDVIAGFSVTINAAKAKDEENSEIHRIKNELEQVKAARSLTENTQPAPSQPSAEEPPPETPARAD